MSSFDYDKIKDMEYDPDRGRYIGKDGSELKVTPYSSGSGYKFDYYDRSTYGETKHNSTHVNSDLNENWRRTDNDRDKGTQENSSGSGCYLVTACMRYLKEDFVNDCYELRVLRWFRDNYVLQDDIKHYYEVAPIIVEAINKDKHNDIIYNYIYDNVVDYCVREIEKGNYNEAYYRYKSTILCFENQFAKLYLEEKLVRTLDMAKRG